MKNWTILILIAFSSVQAAAISCVSFTKSSNTLLKNMRQLEANEQFDQLLMAARSVYDLKTFEFATDKYPKYNHLKGVELSTKEIRFMMTLFLDHSFTHLPGEVIIAGRKALEDIVFINLTDKEKIALALTYLHPKETRDYEKAMGILLQLETSQSRWHLAEIYYMMGEFEKALEQLNLIEHLSGHLSAKTQDAIHAVSHKMKGGDFTNRAEESAFDNTQWGAFQP